MLRGHCRHKRLRANQRMAGRVPFSLTRHCNHAKCVHRYHACLRKALLEKLNDCIRIPTINADSIDFLVILVLEFLPEPNNVNACALLVCAIVCERACVCERTHSVRACVCMYVYIHASKHACIYIDCNLQSWAACLANAVF